MLTKEENDQLTQTGPGTPCGEFMRRYWQPVALSEELPPDRPALAVRLLGEDLVLYRDGQGRLGLLGRYCSHRGADLSYGQVEEVGLRCFYHGWLYDLHGRCLEQPLEPPESAFHEQIRHRAYPCHEQAGIVFAYLGPGEPPLLPAYEFLAVPDEYRRGTKYLQECNYLQGAEGSIDPMQLFFLRRMLGRGNDSGSDEQAEGQGLTVDPEATDFGMRLFTVRPAGPDARSVEIRSFMLPNLCGMAAIGMDGYTVHWHVPIDDTHHWRYVVVFRRDRPVTEDEARRNGVQAAPGYRLDPGETRRLLQEPDEAEPNFVAYSTALAESQGPIYDRTQEYLTDTDSGIIAMRTIVHRAIQDVQEGADPPHVVRDAAANDFRHIVAREDVLASGEDWRSHWRGQARRATRRAR